MNKFITKSNSSKQCYNLAKMATELQVNTLVLGSPQSGKKLLAKEICENCECYDIVDFETLIKEDKIPSNTSIIVYNIDCANNLSYIIKIATKCDIRIIATASTNNDILRDNFLVTIPTTPFIERKEDVEFISNQYFLEAKKIFNVKNLDLQTINKLDINAILEQNISLKEYIYKYLALNSISTNQLQDIVEYHLEKEFKKINKNNLDNSMDYKDFISIFEIPILKSAIKVFKSQLNISKMLKINRMTLRKKLFLYGLD